MNRTAAIAERVRSWFNYKPNPIYVVDPEDFQINSQLNKRGYVARLSLSRETNKLEAGWLDHYLTGYNVLLFSADRSKNRRTNEVTDYGHFMLETDDAIIIIYSSPQNTAYFHVWSNTTDICEKYCNEFSEKFFKEKAEDVLDEQTLLRTVTFWGSSGNDYDEYSRKVQLFNWEDVASNYPNSVHQEIEGLRNIEPPVDGGRIIIMHGPPGTGKTSFIRTLAHAWSDWCHTSYIIDPENLFNSPGAMLKVMTWNYEHYIKSGVPPENAYHLLVIEDAEELIRGDAQRTQGQAMARLLNVADGLLGHSAKLLILITTNADVQELHKALARPGRCLAKIHFDEFPRDEAINWITAHHPDIDNPEQVLKWIIDHRTEHKNGTGYSLAELYEGVSTRKQIRHAQEFVRPGMYL